jgi:hypothetical protein
VRVAFVVLTVFGGSGLVLYLAGWLFIPEDGRPDSAGERFFRDHNALAIAAAAVVGIFLVGPMLAWGIWGDGPGFGGIVLLFLVVAGVVALTRRGGPPSQEAGTPAPAAPPTAQPVAGAAQDSTTPVPAPSATGPGAPTVALPTAPPSPAPAPKEKSVLGRLTFGLTVLVAGTLIALDLSGVISVTAVTVLSVSLGVVALGLLVGAFVGRSRWLIALGVAIVLVLIPLAALPTDVRWNTGAGAGDRVYRVTSAQDLESEYALGAGSLTLDLRRLEVTGPTSIDASVGFGELIVLLPSDLTVGADADVAVGTVAFPDRESVDGVDVAQSWAQLGIPGEYPPGASLELTLSAGVGEITIDTPQEASR